MRKKKEKMEKAANFEKYIDLLFVNTQNNTQM